MHDTALEIGSKVLAIYATAPRAAIVEIGAMDVNGSLRRFCPDTATYLGVDVEHGKSVDIVVEPGQPLPLRANFADVLISTSQMEHDPRFWMTFLDLCRVTKPGGVIYMNAPSNGCFHSYPVDNWRFYPDAAKALVQWANENGHPLVLIESFTAARKKDTWNDFVAVFHMGPWPEGKAVDFLTNHFDARNVWRIGETAILKKQEKTEDQTIILDLKRQVEILDGQVETSRLHIAELEAKLRAVTDERTSDRRVAAG